MRHKLKKGAKVFIFARRQQIRINVSFKWQNANSVDKINLPSEANLLPILRVVQIQVILILKSMSDRGDSDIERLWLWMMSSSTDFESI